MTGKEQMDCTHPTVTWVSREVGTPENLHVVHRFTCEWCLIEAVLVMHIATYPANG